MNQIKAAIAFGESFPEPSETVRSIITEQSQWQSNINVMGEIVATRSLDVRNELAGIVPKNRLTASDFTVKAFCL